MEKGAPGHRFDAEGLARACDRPATTSMTSSQAGPALRRPRSRLPERVLLNSRRPQVPVRNGISMLAKLVLAALLALAALPGSAPAAEPYPDRPISMIVPYAAGGSSDVLARLIGERLGKSLGQQIIVDNRAGAGSRLGTEVAAKAAPDGHTLLLADMPHTIVPAIQKGVPYDPVRDFTPIGLIGTASMFFFVNPAVKAESAQEFVALAKASPDKITIASGGIGSATHLTAELLQAKTGIKLVHVPFRGAGPAMNDLVAGHVQSGFTTLATASSVLDRVRA